MKLLNEKGEFINAVEGKELIKVSEPKNYHQSTKKGDVFFKMTVISSMLIKF